MKVFQVREREQTTKLPKWRERNCQIPAKKTSGTTHLNGRVCFNEWRALLVKQKTTWDFTPFSVEYKKSNVTKYEEKLDPGEVDFKGDKFTDTVGPKLDGNKRIESGRAFDFKINFRSVWSKKCWFPSAKNSSPHISHVVEKFDLKVCGECFREAFRDFDLEGKTKTEVKTLTKESSFCHKVGLDFRNLNRSEIRPRSAGD